MLYADEQVKDVFYSKLKYCKLPKHDEVATSFQGYNFMNLPCHFVFFLLLALLVWDILVLVK